MPVTKVAYNALTKVVTLLPSAGVIPSGSTNLGNYDHPELTTAHPLGAGISHVDYHHVQEMLYKLGQLDMQIVKIVRNNVILVTGVTVAPDTVSLAVDETVQLVPTVAPPEATTKTVSYESSDITKATVSDTGLVTAIADGTADITVTTVDGEKTAVCAVTVTT